MRYTFNMVTMMKEKVNTHFSFPLRLDMTPYTEDFLMGKGERKEGSSQRAAFTQNDPNISNWLWIWKQLHATVNPLNSLTVNLKLTLNH